MPIAPLNPAPKVKKNGDVDWVTQKLKQIPGNKACAIASQDKVRFCNTTKPPQIAAELPIAQRPIRTCTQISCW